MKKAYAVVLIIVGLIVSNQTFSQYELYKAVDGVEFSTRWVKEKWYKRKSEKVLSIQVINTNDVPVQYTLGIEFFQNGVMIESSPEKDYTLKAKGKVKGRLNGVMFKPEKVIATDVESKNVVMELSGLDITVLEKTN